MREFIDKIILLMISILLAVKAGGEMAPVIAFLIGLTEGALGFCMQEKSRQAVVSLIFFLLCFWVPELYLFLPIVFYDSAQKRIFLGLAGLLPLLLRGMQQQNQWDAVLLLIVSGTAVWLAWRAEKQERLEAEMIYMRDADMELNLTLEEKNRCLMEQQDNEIYLATLKERNRIAREIHDNVGHMLSRAILQMGALQTIYKNEENLYEQLCSVTETLNMAMTNIRESVHDLHDDSVDLEQAMLEIIQPMRQTYQVVFDYDMGKEIPRNIKYCFLTVTKEAMSNIVKHSDAKQINIILREHPLLFQLKIEDDGGVCDRKAETEEELMNAQGMGISNMKKRVENLNGTFRVSREQGFRIFISIPKE